VRQADDEYGGAPPKRMCPSSVTAERVDQILMLIVEHCRKPICHRLAPLPRTGIGAMEPPGLMSLQPSWMGRPSKRWVKKA
jgi:hypothetical protein